jgi:hypothetical protein
VGRDPLVDDHSRPAVEAVEGDKPPGEFRRPLGILPLRGHTIVRPGDLQEQGRRRNPGAEAAETPPERPAEIQHPEVEPSPGPDEDAIGRGHAG